MLVYCFDFFLSHFLFGLCCHTVQSAAMFSNKHAAVCLLRGKNFADTVDGGDGDGDKFANKQ